MKGEEPEERGKGMRRKDREITEKREILDVLSRCDTIRIAMNGGEYPYVVPVSFGMEVVNETAIVYFHCAKQGMKVDMLQADPRVCVEGDIFIKVEATAQGITARYESVIGFGLCTFVTEPEEVLHGLKLLIDHYGYQDHPLDRCAGLPHLLLGKIVLSEITGKRNLGNR